MNVADKMLARVGRALSAAGEKALSASRMRHPGMAFMLFGPSAHRPGLAEMSNEIGDGTSSDVLMIPLRWLWRAIGEAPMVVSDDEGSPVENSALQDLLDKPNDFYAIEHLLAATVYSLGIDGNAYWILTSDGNGDVTDIWYEPHTNVRPKWPDDGSQFISHYEYTPGTDPIRLEVNDVIHFRDGIDPGNLRLGMSPLKSMLREVWSDDEAAMFTSALLKNGGIPGVVISPASSDAELPQEEIEAMQTRFESKYTRTGRGRVLGLTGPVKVEQFGFDPKAMDLSSLRDVSEERVCAMLGVPAAVAGFGAGLQTAKVGATMGELVKLAWTGGVLPLQRIIAGEITRALAEEGQEVGFDTSEIEALRESADSVAERVRGLVKDGIFTRAMALIELGVEPGPGDDVYIMSTSVVEVPRGQSLADVVPQSGNGQPQNGDEGDVDESAGDDDGDGLEERRAALWSAIHRKRHSETEIRIVSSAPRARNIPARVRAFTRATDRIHQKAPIAFEEQLKQFFLALGEDVSRVAMSRLEVVGLEQRADDDAATKQAEPFPGLDSLVDEIMIAAEMPLKEAELAELYGLQYLAVARETMGAMVSTMGIGIVLSDPEQVEILSQGGSRAGLIDMTGQARKSLFDALADARSEGLAGRNLASRIRDGVSLRPDQWRAVENFEIELGLARPGSTVTRGGFGVNESPFVVRVPEGGLTIEQRAAEALRYREFQVGVRAKMIARTEGAHAANTATLTAARSLPRTEHVLVTDDRLGFGDTDCVIANGKVVTIREADAMGLAHPNCTRGFTPVNDTLLRELDLETVGQDLRLVRPI